MLLSSPWSLHNKPAVRTSTILGLWVINSHANLSITTAPSDHILYDRSRGIKLNLQHTPENARPMLTHPIILNIAKATLQSTDNGYITHTWYIY